MAEPEPPRERVECQPRFGLQIGLTRRREQSLGTPQGRSWVSRFPKEWRDALVEAEPEKFSLPGQSDLRYHWVHVRLAAIDADEMRDLVEDAWAFVVPKCVAEEYGASRGSRQALSGRQALEEDGLTRAQRAKDHSGCNGCTRRSLGFGGVRSPAPTPLQTAGFGERKRTGANGRQPLPCRRSWVRVPSSALRSLLDRALLLALPLDGRRDANRFHGRSGGGRLRAA